MVHELPLVHGPTQSMGTQVWSKQIGTEELAKWASKRDLYTVILISFSIILLHAHPGIPNFIIRLGI